MDEESSTEIKKVYDIVNKPGKFPVSTIKTAEAVKLTEKSQRDINIAFMNEIEIICLIAASATKAPILSLTLRPLRMIWL